MKNNLIYEAYNEVEFLKTKLEKERCNDMGNKDIKFTDLPLLEKNEIIEDSLNLVAPRYLPLLYKDELLRYDTSGSTGKILEVYWRKKDYMRSMFSLWFYRKKFYSINTWDKVCEFLTAEQIGKHGQKSIYCKNSLIFSKNNLSENRLIEIYNEMIDFQPDWLLLQPCIAELLCYIKTKYQLSNISSIRYIELTGEELTLNLRDSLQRCFMCPIANQYGLCEVNSVAYECPQGNLHCMSDNVYVEIIDDNGNLLPSKVSGNIYITTLHNRVMPFIRYGTGDIGYIEENACSCGHRGKILHLKSGRKDDWILTERGEKINPYVFVHSVIAVNSIFGKCIFQFQVIQKSYKYFIVKLALEEPTEGIQKCFVDNIGEDSLKNAEYEFIFNDKLFPDITGKRRFFKCDFCGKGINNERINLQKNN